MLYEHEPNGSMSDVTFAEFFERRVAATPDCPVVCDGGAPVSLGALNAHANRIASATGEARREMGNGRPNVGVLAAHRAPKVAAVVGMLKTDLLHAVIDPALPDRSIVELLEHAECRIVLADNAQFDRMTTLVGGDRAVINIERLGPAVPDHNVPVTIDPGVEAVITYTSGSTGSPKGVIHSHRTLLHLAHRCARVYEMEPADRLAFFDAFWYPILIPALLSGASVYMLDLKAHDLGEVGAWIERNRITIYAGYPTAFRRLIGGLRGRREGASVRMIMLVGEPVFSSDIAAMRDHFPRDCVFANTYGSTEYPTITSYLFTVGAEERRDDIPAGYPSADTDVLILDDDGNLQRPGEVGLIAVRSPYLSLGYWRRPDLTERHFPPDPVGDGQRIYMTGDLGRMDATGCLFVVGRSDDQVKVRNHRVVLSEVEDALVGCGDLRQAAVKPFENARGDVRLAAYVVPSQGADFRAASLRDALKKRLPDYMVPSVIEPMEALPMTRTGKVDRLALPRPKTLRRDEPFSYAAPRNGIERELVEVWEELLGLTGVGVEDDFFQIGGDSLQAVQVFIEAHDRFGVVLEAGELMAGANTISGLARVIERRRASTAGEPMLDVGAELPDVDFVEFHGLRVGRNPSDLFYTDRKTTLRLARPRMRLGRVETNGLGFRGPEISAAKPDKTLRLAFLGDSRTYDGFVDNEAAWPHRAWVELKLKFPGLPLDYVNAALPGYNTRQITVLFQEYVATLSPDVVVIRAGDMNVDTAYLARKAGIYSGVHHRASRLARRSPLWAKVEMNAVILWRLAQAERPEGKLVFEPRQISRGFEERLERLVRLCQSRTALVVLTLGAGRLRREGSRWHRLLAAQTSVFYMPYLTISGLLDAQEEYHRAHRRVAERTGAILLDLEDVVPGDGKHFIDSNHYREAGSERFGLAFSRALAEAPAFRQFVSERVRAEKPGGWSRTGGSLAPSNE
jgi:acyl-coenzyme A synthetase/AMP-(fatty) acid ligase/acyl carrier protein